MLELAGNVAFKLAKASTEPDQCLFIQDLVAKRDHLMLMENLLRFGEGPIIDRGKIKAADAGAERAATRLYDYWHGVSPGLLIYNTLHKTRLEAASGGRVSRDVFHPDRADRRGRLDRHRRQIAGRRG